MTLHHLRRAAADSKPGADEAPTCATCDEYRPLGARLICRRGVELRALGGYEQNPPADFSCSYHRPRREAA